MAILSINHVTTYRYHRPVAFGAHRMMLRPRDDDDQKVLQAELAIAPEPKELAWKLDRLGNHVAIARFSERSNELRFTSHARLDHASKEFRPADIERYARNCPFSYRADDWLQLRRFILPVPLHTDLRRWGDQFFRADGFADTYGLLVQITRTIHQTFRHVARHEKGIQLPVSTLALGSGSCRDLAVFMVAALRSRGIAARFVSGYLHLADAAQYEDEWPLTGGNTHAWVQAYIPGAGWIDFDPSAGAVGNHKLIRVAVVRHPSYAIPLRGTWYGSASDHLEMQVAVRVRAVNH